MLLYKVNCPAYIVLSFIIVNNLTTAFMQYHKNTSNDSNICVKFYSDSSNSIEMLTFIRYPRWTLSFYGVIPVEVALSIPVINNSSIMLPIAFTNIIKLFNSINY